MADSCNATALGIPISSAGCRRRVLESPRMYRETVSRLTPKKFAKSRLDSPPAARSRTCWTWWSVSFSGIAGVPFCYDGHIIRCCRRRVQLIVFMGVVGPLMPAMPTACTMYTRCAPAIHQQASSSTNKNSRISPAVLVLLSGFICQQGQWRRHF